MSRSSSSDSERLLMIVDEHWIKYVFPTFVYVSLTLVSLFLFYISGFNAYHSPWLSRIAFVGALSLLVIVHHWFFFRLLSDAADCIIITNQRSIQFETTLLLHDVMRENSFDKMRTVEAYKEGFLQNVLNYGTVRFQGGTDIVLVPHPNRLAKDIEQAMGRR